MGGCEGRQHMTDARAGGLESDIRKQTEKREGKSANQVSRRARGHGESLVCSVRSRLAMPRGRWCIHTMAPLPAIHSGRRCYFAMRERWERGRGGLLVYSSRPLLLAHLCHSRPSLLGAWWFLVCCRGRRARRTTKVAPLPTWNPSRCLPVLVLVPCCLLLLSSVDPVLELLSLAYLSIPGLPLYFPS